jgi:haloacetate dehalogenase
LLHGFPETSEAWRHVAPALAEIHSVVCPDLPGYGESTAPHANLPERFAKRTTASIMVELMRRLGHDRFAVVGHDRGALVALRAALDQPERISHLVVMDVIPTAPLWDSIAGVAGVFAFHLYLLAQPTDLPERMIGADPDTFFGHFFDHWARVDGAIPPATRERYLTACRRPEVIHAICEDYRAGASIDVHHDRADRARSHLVEAPTLALWQDPGDTPLPFDPAEIWADWASDLRTGTIASGHFLPEERPADIVRALRAHLAEQR